MGMELDKPKLMYKHVKGGIVLVRNDFSIKKWYIYDRKEIIKWYLM